MVKLRSRLLLLPGLEGSGELFDGLIEELGPRFESCVVRYPAACRTYVDAEPPVRELLPGSRPCVIVAESFSTPLAVSLVASQQHQIDGLILCNGFVANPLSRIKSMMAAATAPWFFHLPLTSFAARTFLVGCDASQQLTDAVKTAIAPVAPATLAARLQAVVSCDARNALQNLSPPMLYLHSTRDRLIGAAGLNEILRIKPDVQVEQIDGPHLLLQKEPRRCAEIICHFIERTLTRE